LDVQQSRDGVGLVWAVLFDNEMIGYWPAQLFRSLGNGATDLEIGGEVAFSSRPPGTRLSKTQMGSGSFPPKGYRHAAFIRGIQIWGDDGNEFDPDEESHETKPECYKVHYLTSDIPRWGKHLYYGGPGGDSPDCVA
jgi:hypothetical protein